MFKFQRFTFLLVLFPVMLLLQSCQPDYVKSQSGHYARKLGVYNDFTFSRWNNRRIESNVSITVVSDNIERVDAIALSKVVADNLSPYFERVIGGYAKDSVAAGQTLAKMQGTNFLFYIQLNDADTPLAGDDEGSDYSGLQLTITLLDVITGHTLDKIILSADSSWVKLLGDDMHGLLAEPVQKIAQDLTGV